MAVQPTIKQEGIFSKLSRHLCKKGYPLTGYVHSGDCYKFGSPIQCYIQYISSNARIKPKGSVHVLVKTNQRNINRNFLKGNNFFGSSRDVFVIPGDQNSYKDAERLIKTI